MAAGAAELRVGHLAMTSHPDEVAQLIRTAAEGAEA